MNSGRLAHWQNVYREKAENQVSWFQETPAISLELIEAVHPKFDSAIVDIGGGASRLVDRLAREGYRDLTVLDVSENAIAMARARMGEPAEAVRWIVADVMQWEPTRRYDLWHDRAAFHSSAGPKRLCRMPGERASPRRARHHRYLRDGWTGAVQRLARNPLRRRPAVRHAWERLCAR